MRPERALRGVSAAPGIATGMAIVLDRRRAREPKSIPVADRASELERARHALEVVATDLEKAPDTLRDAGRNEEADIVQMVAFSATSPGLAARVESLVVEVGQPAAD